jgi:glycosyltransferase involved in cell wall biosynthesis
VARGCVEAGSADRVRALGLHPGHYVLFVGRLVPEKAPDLLIDAFRSVPGPHQLAIVGGSSFTDGYEAELQRLAARDRRVVLTGYTFGRDLEDLYANAAAFVLPSSLEGMPLTLLEAGARELPLVASDIEPHREVLGDEGPGRRFFRCGDRDALVDVLKRTLAGDPADRIASASFAGELQERYSWETVTDATESLYEHVRRSRRRAPAPDVYTDAMARVAERSPDHSDEREDIPA